MDSDQESNTSDSSSDGKSDSYDESGSDCGEDEDEDEDTNDDEDPDEDEEALEQNWSQKFIQDTNSPWQEVKGHTNIVFTKTIKPIDVFEKFFTKGVVDLMVKYTNIYGKQRSLAQKRTSDWQQVNENTIHSFLGLLIIIGLHRLPRIRDYWRRNKIFHTEVVASVMPRNEFYRIFTAFHLCDNTKRHQLEKNSKSFKLFKVYDFISALKKNFQENFTLGTDICVDESMIKFKGRSSLKQYMSSKPIKRGYKVWFWQIHRLAIFIISMYIVGDKKTDGEHWVRMLCCSLLAKLIW